LGLKIWVEKLGLKIEILGFENLVTGEQVLGVES
jgi:hypothetical protein